MDKIIHKMACKGYAFLELFSQLSKTTLNQLLHYVKIFQGDVFNKEQIFIPINDNHHWTFCVSYYLWQPPPP